MCLIIKWMVFTVHLSVLSFTGQALALFHFSQSPEAIYFANWSFVDMLHIWEMTQPNLRFSQNLKFGWHCEIWLKFWNLVEILKFGQTFEIWSKFGQNSEIWSKFLCLQILYLKIFHLKILNWICRQCVDCQVRNIDSDCLLLEKSTVTLASRLSTY